MSDRRIVLLIPRDAADAETRFWKNFCERVKHAISQEGLTCRILAVTDHAPIVPAAKADETKEPQS